MPPQKPGRRGSEEEEGREKAKVLASENLHNLFFSLLGMRDPGDPRALETIPSFILVY